MTFCVTAGSTSLCFANKIVLHSSKISPKVGSLFLAYRNVNVLVLLYFNEVFKINLSYQKSLSEQQRMSGNMPSVFTLSIRPTMFSSAAARNILQ